jgi:hypothetical protein
MNGRRKEVAGLVRIRRLRSTTRPASEPEYLPDHQCASHRKACSTNLAFFSTHTVSNDQFVEIPGKQLFQALPRDVSIRE